MTRQVIEVTPAGINADLPPDRVSPDSWTGGINVGVRDGISERILGYENVLGTPTDPPIWLLPALTTDVAYWVYGTGPDLADQGLWVTEGTTHSDITPAGGVNYGSKRNPFTGVIFNGVPIINWGEGQAPVSWDLQPGNVATELPGWPANTSCAAIRAFKNYLIAMNITENGDTIENLILWSSSAPPGSLPTEWSPTPSNDSGFRSLASTPGPVVDGVQLRNQFLLYKHGSTYTLDLIGGTFIFALRLLFHTTGVLSRNCLAEFQGKVLAFTDGDITISDGHSVDSLIDRRMRKNIFSQISSDNFENAFVGLYTSRREIWFCYPTGSDVHPSRAAVWDYEQNKWTIRELLQTPYATQGVVGTTTPDTWANETVGWNERTGAWDEANFNPTVDNMIMAQQADGFFVADSGITNADGSDLVNRFERDSLDFGNPLVVKTVRSVWLRITGTQGDIVKVRVGGQIDVDDPIAWSAVQDFVIGVDQKVDVFAHGRLLSFSFESERGAPWRHSGFGVEFADSGSNY